MQTAIHNEIENNQAAYTGFPSWPHFDEDEIKAVSDVLHSGKVNYWTGEQCKLFEQEFAAFIGCKHAISLANGTVALELALRALGIGAGDEVITTSRTFIASASAAVICGATPRIADVDPVSQNITADTIQRLITPRSRAIITVHHAGWPCDMDSIMHLARTHGLKVIEDCAQAHGATYNGKRVGSFGDAAAFSFCQDKIITTGGEGGMLTTNDTNLWKKAWAFKDHGKSYDVVHSQSHAPGYRWLHESFGTNWRMTEMQAAIGRIQLTKLPGWLVTRRRHASMLNKAFLDIPALRVAIPTSNIEHAYYRYYAFVDLGRLSADWNRDKIMAAINAEGIPCFSGSCSEIYLEKAFDMFAPIERLKVAQELGSTSLAFLVHPTLGQQHIEQTCAAVKKVMQTATRT